MGGGVALYRRVRCDNQLPYVLPGDALLHLRYPDLFGAYPVYGVYDAVEYVVTVDAGEGRLDHHQVGRLLDYAERVAGALLIPAYAARVQCR